MYTTHQVAQRAHVSDNTIRHYVRDYPDLVSPAARGENGARLFVEEDLQALCTLAALKRSGMPLPEAAERVRNQDVPPVIDVEAQPSLQESATSLQAPFAETLTLQQVYITLQRDHAALQRRHEAHLRRQLWTHGVAFYLGVVTMGVVFWLVWLLNQWWYGG